MFIKTTKKATSFFARKYFILVIAGELNSYRRKINRKLQYFFGFLNISNLYQVFEKAIEQKNNF